MIASKSLIKKFQELFPVIPMPKKLAINSHGNEPQAIDSYFKDKAWTAITLSDIKMNYTQPIDTCLTFMTDEAYLYFLPAFIVMEIIDPIGTDASGDSLIFNLILPSYSDIKRSDNDEQFIKKFNAYTVEQKCLIAQFLECEAQETKMDYDELYSKTNKPEILSWSNDAQKALDSYWGQFLPKDEAT